MIIETSIDSIRIDHRYRTDYGDLDGLAASIEQLGLLQPIGINQDHYLVFGHRRLMAFQQLGRSTIPARIIDVPAIVLAEHAENEIRKDFTHSERVAIGKAVEAELGKRQGQRTDLASESQGELVQNFAQVELPGSGQKTREIAAKKAGFGNPETYRQAKTVVDHAEPELVAAMDRGEVSVSAAAKLATAPKPVQQQAVANPKKAVELAKAASAAKSQDIKKTASSIHKSEVQDEIAAMRELRPPRQASEAPPAQERPHDPIFDALLPNGRNIANGDPKALWLWGWLLECEERFLGTAPDPETLAGNFLDFMEQDSQRLIPKITRYLNQLLEVLHEPAS
ncbi:MAG: ParB N-terminal domain-containing protein [Gammaproteobacteria bacterium]|nr:ParB N-terminal domain-containing protein [Gammaproteobacteria bacterium]